MGAAKSARGAGVPDFADAPWLLTGALYVLPDEGHLDDRRHDVSEEEERGWVVHAHMTDRNIRESVDRIKGLTIVPDGSPSPAAISHVAFHEYRATVESLIDRLAAEIEAGRVRNSYLCRAQQEEANVLMAVTEEVKRFRDAVADCPSCGAIPRGGGTASARNWEVGHVVRRISGGPRMTVKKLFDNGGVLCEYVVKGRLVQVIFPGYVLVLAPFIEENPMGQ